MAFPVRDDGATPGYFGVYPAFVTDLVDPDNLGRVEVRFPTLGDAGDRDLRAWATLCSPYADDDQGLQVLPEVGSEVVVAFGAGDFAFPFVIGAAWNGKAHGPRKAKAANNIRVLRSRSHSELEFDDQAGAEKVSITMEGGHEIVLDNAVGDITIRNRNGSVIRIDMAGRIEITANLSVDVTAPMVNVTAPMSRFSGIVSCQTLMTDAFVISPAYTPGVGNIW